jgi:hypothetical protein
MFCQHISNTEDGLSIPSKTQIVSRNPSHSASSLIEHLAAHETARSLGEEICQKRKLYSALIEPKKKENPVLRKRVSSSAKKYTTLAGASTK